MGTSCPSRYDGGRSPRVVRPEGVDELWLDTTDLGIDEAMAEETAIIESNPDVESFSLHEWRDEDSGELVTFTVFHLCRGARTRRPR